MVVGRTQKHVGRLDISVQDTCFVDGSHSAGQIQRQPDHLPPVGTPPLDKRTKHVYGCTSDNVVYENHQTPYESENYLY